MFHLRKLCLTFVFTTTIVLLNSEHASGDNTKIRYATWDQVKGIQIHSVEATNEDEIRSRIPNNYVALSTLQNNISESGWGFLEVHTNAEYADELQAEAAGFVEGALTHELIYKHWFNTMYDFCAGRNQLCQTIQDYVDENQQWVDEMIANYSSTQPYWHQVKLFYKQLEGLADGYKKSNTNATEALTLNDFVWLNIEGDLEDLTSALYPNVTEGWAQEGWAQFHGRVLGSGSCSALVKLLPNSSDLYVAHDTWNSYQSMLRLQKKYVLKYHTLADAETLVPGYTMTFSSYPGNIQSGDDFYLISSGLATLETTIGNSNASLWQFVKPKGQVLESVRSMVANRLGHCGRSWSKIFSHYNSGTYNNQWMVVDYKLFKTGTAQARLPNGLLWVLEQIPGLVHAQDQTEVLRAQSYWPSYNVPAFPDVFSLSGVPELVERYGDWFSYERTPRALIFRRDHARVRDLAGMLALMEYNDFRHDPLSRCNCTPPYSAENAIAARNDLNPANGTYPFRALGHRSHGAIDTKVTGAALFTRLQFVARSGPVYNGNLAPFRWSEADFGNSTPHLGHPDLWRFQPVMHTWLQM